MRSTLKLWLLPSATLRRRIWPLAFGLFYVAAIKFLGGLETKHVIVGSLFFLDAYNERSRLFLKYFLPFILTGIVYDSMRYFYWQGIEGNVHISEPYLLDKKLFGIAADGKILTPNEFFEKRTWAVADFFCGLAYITFVAEYLFTGFALFFRNQFKLLKTFGWCFFITNVLGFATYFIYPAAPPWYVTQFGFGPARTDVRGSAAAAVRFDELLGTNFFGTMYSQSVDVYGAYPSLHVAYPFLVAWVAFKVKKLRVPAVAFYFLMCFSAVYLQHHYIVDILMGTTYATVVLAVLTYIERSKEKSLARGMTSFREPLQQRV